MHIDEAEAKFQARNAILDKLLRGEIEPPQAIAEAAAAGLPPIECEPAPHKFNPLERVSWSLPMALAWIATRDIAVVRTFDDGYRAERLFLVFEERSLPSGIVSGWALENRPPPSWADAEIFALLSKAPNAKAELIGKLQSGKLCAKAVNAADDKPTEIAVQEWEWLEIGDDRREPVCLRYTHATHRPVYTKVRLPREAIMDLWPPSLVSPTNPSGIPCAEAPEASAPPLAEPVKGPRAYDFPRLEELMREIMEGSSFTSATQAAIALQKRCETEGVNYPRGNRYEPHGNEGATSGAKYIVEQLGLTDAARWPGLVRQGNRRGRGSNANAS